MNGFAQELVKVCIQALLSLTAQGMDRAWIDAATMTTLARESA